MYPIGEKFSVSLVTLFDYVVYIRQFHINMALFDLFIFCLYMMIDIIIMNMVCLGKIKTGPAAPARVVVSQAAIMVTGQPAPLLVICRIEQMDLLPVGWTKVC